MFLFNDNPVLNRDPDFDYTSRGRERIFAEIEDYAEFSRFPTVVGDMLYCGGHMSWNWNAILRHGTSGLKKICEAQLRRKTDDESVTYYNGVITMLTALENWNDRHVEMLCEMGMIEQAEICRKVPRYPAESFYEAVQSFYMEYIAVMRENPGGGNSPGRLDYYLWPYLERDIKNGKCTLEDARELIDELFIRINERIWNMDGWVETIVVGGCHPNGASAVNPLSYIMVNSSKELEMIHPAVYVRIPEMCGEEWLDFCADYLVTGKNRAQLLYDKNIMDALEKNGVPTADAADYYCGGCMEIGVQGKTNDYLFNAWHNIPKIVEFSLTGGLSLSDGRVLSSFGSPDLTAWSSFEDFYAEHISKVRRILNMFFRAQDLYSENAQRAYPRYLLSSMVDDCLTRGRSIHEGGVRYADYGSLPIGLADAADSLFAVKKAVFEDGICSADELLSALNADFEGYEELRRRLLSIPKYGQNNSEADGFARRYFSDISDIYTSFVTRWGGKGKMIVFTFLWSAEAGRELGATPSGKLAGQPVAHGVTPHSSSMTEGITSAINSCTALDFTKFNGGASAMWDLAPEFATPEIEKALFTAFFKNGGQIFQGNTTDVGELMAAQSDPEAHRELMVRVGGFSARFVYLEKQVQDEIIGRIRHKR